MHSLDHVVSERLRAVNAWELARYAEAQGRLRQDWSKILDEAPGFAHDEAVLRVVEQEARRADARRAAARLWCLPAPSICSVAPRASTFRSLFLKNIGGVPGNSDVWWDADFVAIDGVSGKLQSWIDYVDTAHLCTQATAANQVPAPAASASFSGAKVATWTTSQLYVSNRAAAAWTYIGDGNGSSTYVAARNSSVAGTSRLLYGTSSAAMIHGCSNFVFGTSMFVAVSKQGTATNYVPQTNVGTLGATASYLEFLEGSTLRATFATKLSTVAQLTAAYGNTPDASPAGVPLHLGANPGPAAPWIGDIRSFHSFRRILSDAERLVWQQNNQARTGILP